MKRLIGIALVLVLAGSIAMMVPSRVYSAAEVSNDSILIPEEKYEREAMIVHSVLTNIHYQKNDIPVNDSLSAAIYDQFLTRLDPGKFYFTTAQVEHFEQYRYELDEDIEHGDLEFAYAMFNTYRELALARIDWTLERLEGEPFDFTINETYKLDREQASYASTQAELDEVWRKFLKNQALAYRLGDEEKTWEDISKALIRRYERTKRTYEQFKSEDVFQLTMNTFAEAFDPHTNYFSPVSSENFQINMSQSLEGIGARLQSDLDYTKVADIVPGGPAYKSKLLFANDRIIGVAQGVDEDFVDVIGWRLDDVVKLIRGPKGTVVRLKILKAADGPSALPSVITLVRDKVNLEDEVAKSQIVPVNIDGQNYRVGIVTVPSFYMEFEAASRGEKDYNSTTRDVKRLITEMQNDGGIDAVLIDLRYNGGGSLQEAITLSGLFIPDGPVVQVKDYRGRITVNDDPDPELFYDGPLGVMVNRFSASASEIFAGAIQDYERGVIMGDVTYGKGTVQNLIGLNNLPLAENIDDQLGNIKITLAKFYRVTGSSTQTLGVTPDVMFPSEFDRDEYGEISQPNELPWDQIRSTRFTKMNSVDARDFEILNQYHQDRLMTDADLKALLDEQEMAREAREISEISLNEATRRAEQEERQQRLAQQENLLDDAIDPTGEGGVVNGKEDVDDTLLWEGVILMAKLIGLQMG